MGVLDSLQTEQLHREVYIAILNSALQKPGEKSRLVRRVGISPQYLSYLLQSEMDNSSNSRLPNARIAEKIARELPLEPEQRERLLEHMNLARETTIHPVRMTLPDNPRIYVNELTEAGHEASITLDPQMAREKCIYIREKCLQLLRYAVLYTYPFETVKVCMSLHEALCILNQAEDALYYAKFAHAIMENLPRDNYSGNDRERLDRYTIQAIGAEARAYSDLRLYNKAYQTCLQAEAKAGKIHYQSDTILSQLYRDRLQALCRKPRFALEEAEGLVDSVKMLCERAESDLAPRWLFLANQYLVRAYLNYASDLSLKKAGRLLAEIARQMPDTPHMSPLYQTLFLKTYAKFYWKKGAYIEWEYFIKQAITSAIDAGLAHQISDIKRTYGDALLPLFKDLEAR